MNAGPQGGGGNFSGPVADHAGRKNKEELEKAAERRRLAEGPQLQELEIIPGIKRANYLPALGRMADDFELKDAILEAGTEEARTYDAPRKDRPGDGKDKPQGTRPRVLKGATVYLHGNYPPFIVLALRWGAQKGFLNPSPALDANLIHMAELFSKQYGVRMVAACRHTANPYTGYKLKAMGWKTPQKVVVDEKFGGWNYHLQFYISRVTDRKYVSNHRRFRLCQDVVVSTLWLLKELKLDVHMIDRTTREYKYRQAYRKGSEKLPIGIEAAIAAEELSREKAIEEAVAKKMEIWDARWLTEDDSAKESDKPKRSKNASERLEFLLEDKSKVQEPADWFLSREATADFEKRLVELDARYGPLLAKARTVYAELKRQHCTEGYKRPLNDLVNAYEKAEADAAEEDARKAREAVDLAAKAAADEQLGKIAALEAQNVALANQAIAAEAKRKEEEALKVAAAEDAKAQRDTVTALEAKNAALTAAALKQGPAQAKFTPEFLMASLKEANALNAAGRDLSSMSPRARLAVEIYPPTRTKRIMAMVDGRRELVPVLDEAGMTVEEPHPAAGLVGLSDEALQFVQDEIEALEAVVRGTANATKGAEAKTILADLKGVLESHLASIAPEPVDWNLATAAIERIRSRRPEANDLNFFKPKYRKMAHEAAANGDQYAAVFLEEYDACQREIGSPKPSPTPTPRAPKLDR